MSCQSMSFHPTSQGMTGAYPSKARHGTPLLTLAVSIRLGFKRSSLPKSINIFTPNKFYEISSLGLYNKALLLTIIAYHDRKKVYTIGNR